MFDYLLVTTGVLAVGTLATHLLVGRSRYIKQLKEKQATRLQKAWLNGDRTVTDAEWHSLQEDIADYELLTTYLLRLRACGVVLTVLTMAVTLAVYLNIL